MPLGPDPRLPPYRDMVPSVLRLADHGPTFTGHHSTNLLPLSSVHDQP